MTVHQFIYAGGLILSVLVSVIVRAEYGEVPASVPMGFFCVFALLLIIHPATKTPKLVGEEESDRPRSIWEILGTALIALATVVCAVVVSLVIYAITHLTRNDFVTCFIAIVACVGLSTIVYFSGVVHHFVERATLWLSFPFKGST